MSLIKWSPFFDQQPFEEMEKMLEQFQSAGMPVARGSSNGIIPPIDMYETEDAVVVEMPMPGIDATKLDISIENGILSVKGTSERKTEVDDKNYYRKEVRHGSIFRQVALPSKVIADKTEASYENGMLKVMVPKAKGDQGAVKVQLKNKN